MDFIATATPLSRTRRGGVEVEVLESTSTQGGVEVLARAWGLDGKQIGFGKDGTVDIERFRFINLSPIVRDLDGDIINDYIDAEGNLVISRGREDAQEALLRRLEGALAVKKEKFSDTNIVPGKVGSTTTVVDYTPGSGAAGGSVQLNVDGKATYALAHDATTADAAENIAGNAQFNITHNSRGGSGEFYVRRADLQFNTSSIPDTDAISSATVTMWGAATGGSNVDSDTVVLLDNTNNSNIQDPLATEDFNDFTSTSIGSRVLADFTNTGANAAITMTSFGAINKTGNTRIGVRQQKDIDNTQPTGFTYLSISVGTLGDNPFITIEHAPETKKFLSLLGVGT